jgi:hypothetical protein
MRAVEVCGLAGVPLASGYNLRCFASMRELRRVVESGTLGDILHIEGRRRWLARGDNLNVHLEIGALIRCCCLIDGAHEHFDFGFHLGRQLDRMETRIV